MSESHPRVPRLALLALLAVGAGCTVLPTGPSVMTLPGTGRTLEQFRGDDAVCRQYAFEQIGGRTASQASQQSAVSSAAVGTAVGAVAGAAIGGHGSSAAVGAGTGLLLGTAVGSDQARASGIGTQRQYDNAYIQCMYSKGHRVPVPANMSYEKPVRAADAGIPPPPPGTPPGVPPATR
ncbi:MAG TPA: YMGG-like glycine zipper-containing protein [Azonexus sp.]